MDFLETGLTRVSGALSEASRRAAFNSDFFTSFLITAMFVIPMLVRNSESAGFLYTGDVSGLYWPTMMKTATLLSSFNLSALDFSTYNGSSDFFLPPNFFVLHPFIILYSMLFFNAGTTMQDIGNVLAFIIAIHLFVSFYFTIRLLRRYFGFDYWPAVFAAGGYAFSFNIVTALGQPMFVFCTTMLPVAAYAALRFTEAPSVVALIFAAVPLVFIFLAGFVPLAIVCVSLSILIVAVKCLAMPDDASMPREARVRAVLVSFAPYTLASLVVLPYYLSIVGRFKESISAGTASLFYSAHQLAQEPHSILRMLSARLTIPGPFAEFSFSGSGVALAIVLLFVFSPAVRSLITAAQWLLLEISFAIYFILVISTFGDISAVSDMFYYYIPEIGGMHIYQRFLLFGQFFVVVPLAIMLRAVVNARPKLPITATLTGFGLMLTVVSFLVAGKAEAATFMGLSEYIVFDLILATAFLTSLLFQGAVLPYALSVVITLLPSLDYVYDLSKASNSMQEQVKQLPMSLDIAQQDRFLEFLKRFPDKKVVKYVDLTLLWGDDGREPFPKSLSYHFLKGPILSSYHGFDFRMGASKAYLDKMPMVVRNGTWMLSPNWETLASADADFMVVSQADIQSGTLGWIAGQVPASEQLQLPKGNVAVPLRGWNRAHAPRPAGAFDNGVFRIAPVSASPVPLVNLAQGKRATQSSTFGGHDARAAVDGNTDGASAANTYSHTDASLDAWIEVDLGEIHKIEQIGLWNATECCGFRLRNYWVFISDTPFKPTDTAKDLSSRAGVWGQMGFTPNPHVEFAVNGVSGRYVRVQLAGPRPLNEAYLHIAELEVLGHAPGAVDAAPAKATAGVNVTDFKSNFANYHRIEWDNDYPAIAQYLFSDNKRLSYTLNGVRVTPTEKNGLQTIEAPPGRNVIEIRYKHPLLLAFWALFFAFFAAVAACLILIGMRRYRDHARA